MVPHSDACPHALVVDDDATLLQLGDRRVDLRRRAPLRRLVRALVAARAMRPGTAVSPDGLIAAAWPGERIQAKAARNRLHVAIASLRQMGLRAVLLRDDDGYLLAPSLDLAWLPAA